MPRVWNKRHTGWPADAVYVGRPTRWGNPFTIGKDGSRVEVIAKFEAYTSERLAREPGWLTPLRGRDLVCWCVPLPCHADVLLRLANWPALRTISGTAPAPEELLTTRDAARLLGYSVSSVLRFVTAGALPARRVSRTVLTFARADLEAFAATHTPGHAAGTKRPTSGDRRAGEEMAGGDPA